LNILLNEVTSILQSGGITNASDEAARIIQAAHAITLTDQSSTIFVGGDYRIIARFMAKRRAKGTPLAFVIGRELFMGIELIIADGVLSPRKETELLGNTAIDVLRSYGSTAHQIIDVCCGTGNLACAIAHHMPNVHVWASDLTDRCITTTRQNVKHLGISDRVIVAQGDIFGGLAEFDLDVCIDIIVCNPPYISQSKLDTDHAELLKHEPREAFDGGPYGLTIHQRVIKEALPFLKPGGILMLEIGLGQERQVKMLFDRTNAYENIRFTSNTSGEVRVVSGCKRSE